MSLWDTDKGSAKRAMPQLNQNDALVQRVANSTASFNPVSDSSNLASLAGAHKGAFRIINRGTSSIPSFSIASGPTAYSLLTIPHGQSSASLVQVYVSGVLVNFQTGAQIATQYIPLPIFDNNSANNYVFLAADTNLYPLTITWGMDATNIYVQASSDSTAATTINAIPVAYTILQETAN